MQPAQASSRCYRAGTPSLAATGSRSESSVAAGDGGTLPKPRNPRVQDVQGEAKRQESQGEEPAQQEGAARRPSTREERKAGRREAVAARGPQGSKREVCRDRWNFRRKLKKNTLSI